MWMNVLLNLISLFPYMIDKKSYPTLKQKRKSHDNKIFFISYL